MKPSPTITSAREAGAANNGPATGLTDEDFDHMHHALGRPDGPHVEPYRNRFCCGVDSPGAKRFDALPDYWRREYVINGGRDALYAVTPEGRRQTMIWQRRKQEVAGLRRWVVSADHVAEQTVMAKSPSAARACLYYQLADAWSISFRDFLRLKVRVRLA